MELRNIYIEYKTTDGGKLAYKKISFSGDNIVSARIQRTNMADSITMPGQATESAMVFSAGTKLNLSFEIQLRDSVEDMSLGTAAKEIKTIGEKRKFLMKEAWPLEILQKMKFIYNDKFGSFSETVLLDSASIDVSPNNVEFLPLSLSFIVGGKYELENNEEDK